jgi:L-threonylcarbamoyladenylate synthase
LTVTLYCDSELDGPAKEIIAGKVVIYPTDTVYGLGTNPRSAEGVRNCFSIKRRAKEKRLPVLLSDLQTAHLFGKFDMKSRSLAEAFWPGKLTIVLPLADRTLPAELVGTEGTIALRVPNHICCQRLISACGGSLIGTSANISGEEALTDPYDARLANLSTLADFFVFGVCGEAKGPPSTVIDATDENSIKVLREGAISKDRIFAHLENISKTEPSQSAV